MRTRALGSRSSFAPAIATALALTAGCGVEVDDGPSPAQASSPDADGRPLPDVVPHWDALIARSGGVPAVRWGARGTPMSLYGALSGPGLAAGDARGFLAGHARLFRLSDDLAELADEARVDSPLGSHVAFAQREGGVRVLGAEVKVHLDQAGRVIAVNNTSVPGLRIDTRPRISAQAALDVALAAVPAADRADADAPEPAELVVKADAAAPALVYQVAIPTQGPTLEFFIDARTGAVLGEPRDINRYVNGTGQVFKDNAVVATQNNNLVDSNDASAAVPSTAYATVTLQGLNGANRLDGQFASGSNSRSRAVGTNNNFIFLRTSHHEVTCERVSSDVPSDLSRQLRQPAHAPQLAEHDAYLERPTLGIAEYPLATRVAMRSERLPGLVAERHLARLAALGRAEHAAQVALLHVELASGQVDIRPPKTEQLAAPQAGA